MRFASNLGLAAFVALSIHCGRAPDGDTGKSAPAGVDDKPAPREQAKTNAVRVPIDGLPVIGKDTALVTIVEFTDYQCPYCRRAEKTMQALVQTYGDDVRFAIASHPLPMHENAERAARVALAAGQQGKFAEMHARLFAGAVALDDASLMGAAAELGLDREALDGARGGASVDRALAQANALAKSLGVTGTPSFFINGRRVNGAQPLETFKAIIDDELARTRALVASGVRPSDVYGKLMEGAAVPTPDAQGDDGPGCHEQGECDATKKAAVLDEKIYDVPVLDSPVRGFARAPITVTVFSDFECPFSKRLEPTLAALTKAYDNDVRIVWKHNPLPMHDHARLAHKASIAAADQGRFWEYHDAIFAHQDKLDRASLVQYAKDLKLDAARFERDLDAPETESRIAADESEAIRLGVTGTPTAFVNGRRLVGAQPIDVFKGAVEKAVAIAK